MTFAVHDALVLAGILREAARAEILPRFRRLGPGEVRAKTGALDLVTDADEAAERAIEAGVAAAFPGALVIGEEGAGRDPRRLEGLAQADLALVIDPVDGTLNFASGLPLFGVMAAVLRRGEPVCGVILDPIVDDWAVAVRGEGAWIEGPDGRRAPLRVADPVPLAELSGNVSWRYLAPDLRPQVTARLPRVAAAADLRCAAHTYRLLAAGHLHFAFWSSTKPWDHAAGWLIHREAGGYAARFDGGAYDPARLEGGLISAPDRATWEVLREALLPP